MWSYTGDPRDSRKDEVRWLIGDTNFDPDEQLLSDEEILYALQLYPVNTDTPTQLDIGRQPLMAALVCAEAIWSYFQRQVDEQLPVVNFEYGQRAKNYKVKVDDLRKLVVQRGGVVPYVGGISMVDKAANRDNLDRIKPNFSSHLDDNLSTPAATVSNLLDFD